MSEEKKSNLVTSKVMVDFFLKKLFEENLIDTDTYVFAKNMAKEELKNGTKKQVHYRAD